MSQESVISTLLNGIEFDDPRLYDLLNALSSDFYALKNKLEPPTNVTVFGITGQLLGPPAVTMFTATTFGNNLRLTWASAATLSTYEIRYKAGSFTIADWDTAQAILTTGNLSADINPISVPLTTGVHTFLIKSIDASGIYSTLASLVIVTVPVIQAPVITPTVISNNVLLAWTSPVSVFNIDHYNVYKNGILQGQVKGTFEAIFEVIGGTYSYKIEAVDIVGNVSILSSASIVQVGNPNDFVLFATLTSTFAGTKTNCKIDSITGTNLLLACVNTAETYQQHFVNNGWTTPQAQITAGFPYYPEPALANGSYQEVFDFGAVLTNIIVVMNWSLTPVIGAISVTTSTIEFSTDNISWSTVAVGTSVFAAALRYVRFTMTFVGSNVSLAYFSNLQCLLNVHRELDGGSGSAVSTDVAGTVFLFNKAFRSIDSITVTPLTTTACFPVVSFTNSVNPTSFKILLYDNAGVRVTASIQWMARGII